MSKKVKMDQETRNTIRLGIFVSIGLILLIIAVYLIGSKKNMFTSTFHVFAFFSDVSGLQSGDNVRFRGIPIGTVKDINVRNDSTVMVTLLFEKKIRPYIKKNAVASIGTDGLMGNKVVNIRSNNTSSRSILENDTLKTLLPVDMDEVTRKLKSSNDNMEVITDDLSNIMDKINRGEGVIGTLIMDTVFAKNMDQSMKNIEEGTANINKESEALKHNILFRWYLKKERKKK